MHPRLSASLFLTLITALTLSAQRTLTVSGSYTYYPPSSESLDAAKITALERAKVDIIAREFGTVVESAEFSSVEVSDGRSNSRYLRLGEVDVKGEWLETIAEPVYKIGYENGMLVVKVTVKGVVREIISSAPVCEVKTLRNGTRDKFESDSFRDGDALFLSFQAPVDGFVTVYLCAEDGVYRLLPLRNSFHPSTKVAGGVKYVFFTGEGCCPQPESRPDDAGIYNLTCTGMQECNRIYTIFSPNEYVKANDTVGDDEFVPAVTDFAGFQKWLGRCRRSDIEMSVDVKSIIIEAAR